MTEWVKGMSSGVVTATVGFGLADLAMGDFRRGTVTVSIALLVLAVRDRYLHRTSRTATGED